MNTPALPKSGTRGSRLERLFSDSAGFVSRLVRRLGVRDGDVDDVSQRVFFTFARRLHTVRPGAERAFLHAISLREASHQRRTYRRQRESSDELAEPSAPSDARPDGLALHREARAAALAILGSMDESLRAVFVLCELQQASLREVASCLSVPLGTAKARLRRARDAFEAEARQLRYR